METDNSRSILKEVWGYDNFLPNQEIVINSLLERNDTIALLPTGGGKSLCYQIPGLSLNGLTVVVSPLISLITDQVNRLNKIGLSAISLAGDYDLKSWDSILDNAINGEYHFIYISPERAISQKFLSRLKYLPISFIAIDEAHCASQWGHDFRPSYAKLGILKKLLPETPIIALTASATPYVLSDLKTILSLENANIFKSSFYRSNISANIFKVGSKEKILKKLIEPDRGKQIIYCRTRSQTTLWVNKLKDIGIKSLPYHGGLSADMRSKNYSEWSAGDSGCMIATTAFGMGVDEPNVRQVFHIEIPNSIESYYQEIGRAGRDGEKASSYLLIESKNIKAYEKRSKGNEISWSDLRDVYHKIASVGQIAVGDGQNERQSINLLEISRKLEQSKQKVDNAIRILVREGMFLLHDNYRSKPEVRLNYSGSLLVEKLDNMKSYENIAYSLSRNIPKANNQWAQFSLKSLSYWSKTSLAETHEGLNMLSEHGILDWIEMDSKMVLEWLHPRESEGHLSIPMSKIENQNLSKRNKIASVVDLVSSQSCLFSDMLLYFGEEIGDFRCNNCSTCTHGDPSSERNIQKSIFILISKKALSVQEISKSLNLPNDVIDKALVSGVERNLWSSSNKGEYYLL